MNQPSKSTSSEQAVNAQSPVGTRAGYEGNLDSAQTSGNSGLGGSLMGWLNQIPQPVKNASTQVVNRFNQLSTTQKVVGGALLAIGVGYLATAGGSRERNRDAQADTLHELLLFVNDRIEGYKRAVDESQDAQLRGYYKQLVSQSQRFSSELNDYLRQRNGDRETKTTLKGKLYRRFMDATATLTGHSETSILAMNIHGEQWALKAYQDALDDHTLSGTLRQEVERQFAISQKTYQELKRLKEQQS